MEAGQVIIVRVPPERVAWLLRELSSANFPFDTRPDPETGGLAVRAPAGAQSIFSEVLGYKRKRRWKIPYKWLMVILGLVAVGVLIYVTGFDLWVMSLFSGDRTVTNLPNLPVPDPAGSIVDAIQAPIDAAVDGVVQAVQWALSVAIGVALVAVMFAIVLFGRRRK